MGGVISNQEGGEFVTKINGRGLGTKTLPLLPNALHSSCAFWFWIRTQDLPTASEVGGCEGAGGFGRVQQALSKGTAMQTGHAPHANILYRHTPVSTGAR